MSGRVARELAGAAAALALVALVAGVEGRPPATAGGPVTLIAARGVWWPSLAPALANSPALARLARAQHGCLRGEPDLSGGQGLIVRRVDGLPALEEAVRRAGDGTVLVAGWPAPAPNLPAGQGVWLAAGADVIPGPLEGEIRAEEVVPTALALASVPLPPSVAAPCPWVSRVPVRWAPR